MYIWESEFVYLGMAKSPPCRNLVIRCNGGLRRPARNGPGLPMGVLGFPNWILGRTHGLRSSA